MPKLPGQPPPAERKAAGSSCAPTMPQGRSVLPEGRGAAPRLPGKLRASWAGAAAPPAQPDPRARRDRGSQLSIAPNSRARLRRAERALPHPPLSLIGFHHATELKKKKKNGKCMHNHRHRRRRPNPPLFARLPASGRPCNSSWLFLPLPPPPRSPALLFLLPRLKLQLSGWEGYGLRRAGSVGTH
jgi:hypothetical protein